MSKITKTPEQIKAEMDSASIIAEQALAKLPKAQVKVVANWVNQFYMKAGYKRLGRALVQIAKEK